MGYVPLPHSFSLILDPLAREQARMIPPFAYVLGGIVIAALLTERKGGSGAPEPPSPPSPPSPASSVAGDVHVHVHADGTTTKRRRKRKAASPEPKEPPENPDPVSDGEDDEGEADPKNQPENET